MLKVSAKWVSAFLICLLLGGVGGFWLGVQAAPVTSWSIVGDTLNIGKINANTVRDDDIAAGRVVYGGTAGLLSDDAGLTYDAATDTLTVGNLTVGGVPYFAESEASFVVWADAGLYYAKNGHTGAVTSNANFYTLTNAVFTVCTGGETILIKNGAYTLPTTWTITKPLNIVGEGKNTAITFSGTTSALIYDAATQSIRDGSLRNLKINANNRIGITITSDAGDVFSQNILDNLILYNCSKAIYASYSGSTTYKNYFSRMFINTISSRGIHMAGGGYNSFKDIEITGVDDSAYSIYSASGSTTWSEISVDGCMFDSGSGNTWTQTYVEGIYASPPPVDTVFRLTGYNTVVNGLTLTEVENAKCAYGLAIANTGQTINGFNTQGINYPNYPLMFDGGSGGVVNGAYIVGGFTLKLFYTPLALANWVINGGNVYDGTAGSSSVKTHSIQSKTLAGAATTFALTSDIVILTGDGGGNTLATITGGTNGQLLTILFVDSFVTITDTDAATSDTVNLSAAFTGTATDVITLVYSGVKWFEVSRSVN